MRRFLLAAAFLVSAGATTAFGDYVILRRLLETGGAAAPPTGAAPMPGAGGDSAAPGLTQPGGVNPPAEVAELPRAVVVVVPIKGGKGMEIRRPVNPKFTLAPPKNPEWLSVFAQGYGPPPTGNGTTFLFQDGKSVIWHTEGMKTQSFENELLKRHKAWEKGKDPGEAHSIATGVLESGLIDLARKTADEAFEAAKGKGDGLVGRVKDFVAAYAAVGPKLKAAAGRPSNADRWKNDLGARGIRPGKHYAVVFWDQSADEVERIQKALDDNFDAFYLWHALQGKALPVPAAPLVVLLAPRRDPTAGGAMGLHRALDGTPVQADGFYSPPYDLLVLSSEYIDTAGYAYQRQTQNAFQAGEDRKALLKGDVPFAQLGIKVLIEDVARKQTEALVERAFQDASLTAAVSLDGTRQLNVNAGLLPRHVVLPRWVQSGSGSLFHRPRDPVYDTHNPEKPVMTVALTTGYGAANHVMHRHFVNLRDRGGLPADPADLLRNVTSDAYFNAELTVEDPDPVAEPPREPGKPVVPDSPAVVKKRTADRLYWKARSTAWALTYYLAKTRLDDLYAFYAELDKLPRDLPPDGQTVQLLFGKVFGLLAADGASLDPAKVKEFAAGWIGYMRSVKPPTVDVELPALAAPMPMPTGNVNPAVMP